MSNTSTDLTTTTVPLSGPIQIIRMPQAEMESLAKKAGTTGLFGKRSIDEAHLLMAAAESEGKHPLQGLREYDVIQGLIAKKAQAMHADFQRAGGRLQWIERTDKAAEAEFSHPVGGTLTVRWTWDDAVRAGLSNKDTWRKHPRQMLGNRVISEGVRAILPGVVLGMYSDEEVADFDLSERPALGQGQSQERTLSAAPAQRQIAAAPSEDPTPAPAVNRQAVINAMTAFADAARAAGQDVDGDSGKPSRGKMVALLARIHEHIEFGVDVDKLGIEDWDTAREALPAFVKSLEAPAAEASGDVDPAAEGPAAEEATGDQMTDPFADDEEDVFAEDKIPEAKPVLTDESKGKAKKAPANTIAGTDRGKDSRDTGGPEGLL